MKRMLVVWSAGLLLSCGAPPGRPSGLPPPEYEEPKVEPWAAPSAPASPAEPEPAPPEPAAEAVPAPAPAAPAAAPSGSGGSGATLPAGTP